MVSVGRPPTRPPLAFPLGERSPKRDIVRLLIAFEDRLRRLPASQIGQRTTAPLTSPAKSSKREVRGVSSSIAESSH